MNQPRAGQAPSSSPGAPGETGGLAEAQQEYARRLEEARQALNDARAGDAREGAGDARAGSTPEQWAPTTSAPGTEAFKQDFARWDDLRKHASLALERAEATLSARLAARLSRDRLAADLDDHVPDAYRRPVSRYYETISQKDRP